MGLSLTILQAITLGIGFVISYFISRAKPVWWVFALSFIASSALAWIGGILLWGFVFVPENYAEAIVYGMPRSLLFAFIGAGLGIYLAKK